MIYCQKVNLYVYAWFRLLNKQHFANQTVYFSLGKLRAFTSTYWWTPLLGKRKAFKERLGPAYLTSNFFVFEKCDGKLNFLIYEMLFLRTRNRSQKIQNQIPSGQNCLLNKFSFSFTPANILLLFTKSDFPSWFSLCPSSFFL